MDGPRFITFEGLDGSGKSTHIQSAVKWFHDAGLPVVKTQEPGGTPLGEAIRSVFLDPIWKSLDGTVETLLVFASRRQHLIEVIDPALERGSFVLCDRFTDSTFAYQGYGRGVSRSLLERADEIATGGRRPDRTLLFDLSAEEARRRGHSPGRRRAGDVDRLDSEELAFYKRVRRGYLELAEESPDRFHRIDSSGSQDDTEDRVRRALEDLIPLPQAIP